MRYSVKRADRAARCRFTSFKRTRRSKCRPRCSDSADGSSGHPLAGEDAPQRVTGPAFDFCLLVTQRANRTDLALEAVGPDADRWLDIAQAFAGPSGAGRPPKGAGA